MLDIERRKSVRKFNGVPMTEEELDLLNGFISSGITPLFPEVPYRFLVLKREETSCPRGEYCICMYTDRKDLKSLYNTGYILAQVDLFLTEMGIGTCFYGFGRLKRKLLDGLEFTLMLNFGHSDDVYRKEAKANRRNNFADPFDSEVERLSQFAPSACNTQPWYIEVEGSTLTVSRRPMIVSIIKGMWKEFFNRIDVGIYLLYLEKALIHENYTYSRNTVLKNGEYTIVYRTARQ